MDSNCIGVTLFYSKRTGEIISYSACSTPQSFEDYYGTRADDMKIIYDSLFTDFEQDIIDNYKEYKVIDGKLVKKENEIDLLKAENIEMKTRLDIVQLALDEMLLNLMEA